MDLVRVGNKKDYRTLREFVKWYSNKMGNPKRKDLIKTGYGGDYVFVSSLYSPGRPLNKYNLNRLMIALGLTQEELQKLLKEFKSERR